MIDDAMMRFQLQQVVAYRQVCAAVRTGASHTLFNGLLWLGLTWLLYSAIGPDPIVFVQFALGLADIVVGIWKKVRPSPEAVLMDGVILVAFGGFILVRQFLAWQAIIKWPVSPFSIFLGFWWLYDASKSFKAYGALRRAFPDRPTAAQLAWFDDLVREIRTSNPDTDLDAIDLPTRPGWKAKLLGSTAFFVETKGNSLIVVGPDDFEIERERNDQGTGRRKARLRLFDQQHPEFWIGDASWTNYQTWAAKQVRAS